MVIFIQSFMDTTYQIGMIMVEHKTMNIVILMILDLTTYLYIPMKIFFLFTIQRLLIILFKNTDLLRYLDSLIRVESTTGKTVWAKELIYHSGNIYFNIYNAKFINDVAWVLLIYSLTDQNAPGVIVRVDQNGTLIESFYAPFNVNISPYQDYIFSTIDFIVFSDSSFITAAKCGYYKDNFGVSEYSRTDFSYFMVDSNRNFMWSTSIDFTNNYEEYTSMYEYNSILYVAIVTSKYYYWMQTLNSEKGELKNSQCVYVNKLANNINYRHLVIFYASDKFLYW